MAKLLTTEELRIHLEVFRNILSEFDYSSLKNISFFNLESFYNYMDNIKNNPFKKQYDALQKQLDYLQPYLPFVSSERAASFLTDIAKANGDEEVLSIKQDYAQKLRRDFIDLTRSIKNDSGWTHILQTCEEIRVHKEEMCLASY